MELLIPKTIHQIWSGLTEPLPKYFELLAETWKDNHLEWEYILWDHRMMNDFVAENYPELQSKYLGLNHNIQRWDAIRYLILYKSGGMYVDFDYESIEPLDDILKGHSCCFSSEPEEHAQFVNEKRIYFNNALMASVPGHPFMKQVIDAVFDESNNGEQFPNKMFEVLKTTGPLMLCDVYEKYGNKEDVYIIPEELVSPLSKPEIERFLKTGGDDSFNEHLEKKLEKAVAAHYFLGGWLDGCENLYAIINAK